VGVRTTVAKMRGPGCFLPFRHTQELYHLNSSRETMFHRKERVMAKIDIDVTQRTAICFYDGRPPIHCLTFQEAFIEYAHLEEADQRCACLTIGSKKFDFEALKEML
jgi:hypothetical protein